MTVFHGPLCLSLYDTTGWLEEVKEKAEIKRAALG